MDSKQKKYILLFFLVILLFSVNYKTLDSRVINFFDESEKIIVQRVIDGDTIKVNNQSIRLLGINCPEKGEPLSQEATEFLENLILNKSIQIESTKKDLYGRTLAYIFLNNENINLKIIEAGFANAYFPEGKQKYYAQFQEAWQECVKDNLNICEKSNNKCADCIKLKSFDYKTEKIILHNKCNFNCDLQNWYIKDEGRKKFVFPEFVLEKNKEVEVKVTKEKMENTKEKLFWERKTYVWTNSGDTLFLKDDEAKLVLWENY